MVHTAFFGDARRAFTLTPALLIELERKAGVGIGALCQRIFRGEFAAAEVAETIRLALIGGGEPPESASALVETYVIERPLHEGYSLAVAILETVFFGQSKDQERK
ncbi:MAG: gene transfer agent family protein [Proteobacteria bacterium]|nr:gene transfer agent family protein [Pseudomonadota bacterium]